MGLARDAPRRSDIGNSRKCDDNLARNPSGKRPTAMRCIPILVLAILGAPAAADSWALPGKSQSESPDHSARLTVLPRGISSPLAYFEDKVAEREPAGAPSGSTTGSAMAVLELRDPAGQWITAWTRPLVNDVSPVTALVADGGRRIVTFDNWHSMGFGPDAMVFYDGDGKVLRSTGLEDIFPKWFVASQPRSASSIWWRGTPRISDDGNDIVVPIKLPDNADGTDGDSPSLDLPFRLFDGEPVGLTGPAWTSAMAQAADTARKMCKSEMEFIARWNAPITAPTELDERPWHDYLRELVFRSLPVLSEDEQPAVGTTVLRLPSAKDFALSVGWLREALSEKTFAPDFDIRTIGSPDNERLTVEIERIAPSIVPGRLKGVELVIVADEPHATRIRTALSRSGAKMRIVDPSMQFPQRADRMRRTDGEEVPVCLVPPA